MRSPFEWLGQPAAPDVVNIAAWEAYVRAIRDNLNASWMRASRARDTLKSVRERLGLPFMVEPAEGAVRIGAWDAGFEQDFIELGSMVATLTRFANDALAGRRRLGPGDGGAFGFEQLPGDVSRVEVRNGRPVEISSATGQPVVVTGTVGALPPIVLGIIVVAAAVTTYFVVEEVCETVERVAEQKTFETISNNQVRQIEQGATPEQAQALTESIFQGAATVHEARAAEESAGRSEIPQTIRTVGFIALGLGVLYVVAMLLTRRGGGAPMLAPARLLENQVSDINKRRQNIALYGGGGLLAGGLIGGFPGAIVGALAGAAVADTINFGSPFAGFRLRDNPVRRSGDARVRIQYRDEFEDYSGVVTWPGDSWSFGGLRPPRAGVAGGPPVPGLDIAVDSPQAYDVMAETALSFAADENEELFGVADYDFDKNRFRVKRR